jgi:hypothetical protein
MGYFSELDATIKHITIYPAPNRRTVYINGKCKGDWIEDVVNGMDVQESILKEGSDERR